MAKDPAFLFYPGDWQGGTLTMTRHLKGCYIDLLIAQFNSGPLSLEEIRTVLGNDFAAWQGSLSKKFKQDSTGLFCNERLETEKSKRQKFTESRKRNLIKPHMDHHMASHMEDENENRNRIEKQDGVRGRVEYDAEQTVLGNQIEFERILMSVIPAKSFPDGKHILRTYHLYLTENEKYPMTRKQIFAGFEKWLHNEKKFNGSKTNFGSNKPGTSEARVTALKKW